MCVCVRVCMCVYICVHVLKYICVCRYVHALWNVCIYACTYACVCGRYIHTSNMQTHARHLVLSFVCLLIGPLSLHLYLLTKAFLHKHALFHVHFSRAHTGTHTETDILIRTPTRAHIQTNTHTHKQILINAISYSIYVSVSTQSQINGTRLLKGHFNIATEKIILDFPQVNE